MYVVLPTPSLLYSNPDKTVSETNLVPVKKIAADTLDGFLSMEEKTAIALIPQHTTIQAAIVITRKK